ncbi:MAG: hypothetical protein M1833_004527 [Piccolia ochrophora]|nr:MAG: hypothetical protein M1833_004527 [Piccolia ochrophora]
MTKKLHELSGEPNGVLIQWAVNEGAFVHPSLQHVHDAAYGSFFQLRSDALPLPATTQFLSCPHALSISYLNAINLAPFRPRSDPLPESLLQSLPPHSVTVFFLCQQYLQKERSFWWPYIRSLPQPHEGNLTGTPHWFSEQDKLWLRGTNLEKGQEDLETLWKEEWGKGIQLLRDAGCNTQEYTWQLALWAATLLSSRSFTSDMFANVPIDKDNGARNFPDENFSVLFPILDILNHRPGSKITWKPAEENLSLAVCDTLQPGEAIWNNYGPKSNESLLQGYGFCLADNPFDTFGLTYGRLPLTSHQIHILQRQSSYDSFSPTPIHQIRAPHPDPYSYPNCITALTPFPPALLNLSILLVANTRELALLHATPNITWASPDDPSTLIHPAGLRPLFAVASQLLLVLRQKLAKIAAHNRLLPSQPSTRNQRHAAIYRAGQVRILTACISGLESFLKDATTSSSISSPGSTTASLLTLPSALSTLHTASPTKAESFSAGLTAAFGTNDIPALREAGHEDGVWALLLCFMLVAESSSSTSNPPPSPSSSAALHQRHPLHRLLTRLTSQPFYANPLDPSYRPPHPHPPPSDSDPDPEVGVAPEDDQAFEAEQTEFLHSLVVDDAARECTSSPVWTSSRWTTRLVAWGVRVVREEGFVVVLDERDPEEKRGAVVFCLGGG